MNKLSYLFLSLFLGLTFVACVHDDDVPAVDSISESDKAANDFIWKALNRWYYWQAESPNLSDQLVSTTNTSGYFSLINGYTPNDLFYNKLLHQYGTTDRDSYLIENFRTPTTRGVSQSYGMEFLLGGIEGGENLFALVIYTLSNSPANLAGIKRGDFITKVNNTNITEANYKTLLYGNSGTFFVEDISDLGLLGTGHSVSMSAASIDETPILQYDIFTKGSNKVGYLVYNSFDEAYNDELNEVFTYFKSANITDLVLDLRYNGGGSVETAQYLASMISNKSGLFTQLRTNSKINQQYDYNFVDAFTIYDANGTYQSRSNVTRLALNKVYILGTGYTASASELIISCLKPYMNVILIGEKTYGKNVASQLLHDLPSNDYIWNGSGPGPSQKHSYAMQPIIAKNFDKNGLSTYGTDGTKGIDPNKAVSDLASFHDIKPLGDFEEPLLKEALSDINPLFVSRMASRVLKAPATPIEVHAFSKDRNPLNKDMYISPTKSH